MRSAMVRPGWLDQRQWTAQRPALEIGGDGARFTDLRAPALRPMGSVHDLLANRRQWQRENVRVR